MTDTPTPTAAPTPAPAQPVGGQTGATKPNILLVEDEEMLASMYKLKFEKEGFEIEVAHDGEEGLAKAQEKTFGIVLLDIILPKLDGFAVLEKIKTLPQYAAVPVFLLTNLGQDEDMEKGKKLGAADYLVKANFTPSQVLEKIQNIKTS
jgi:DNA-binding response OmpR family regulator